MWSTITASPFGQWHFSVLCTEARAALRESARLHVPRHASGEAGGFTPGPGPPWAVMWFLYLPLFLPDRPSTLYPQSIALSVTIFES